MAARIVIPSSVLGYVKGATGGTNQQHLIYAQNSGRWWFFTWGTTLDSGTATGGSKTQLTDTGKSWTASAYRAATCFIISGPGAGQAFEIGPNTATVLQVYNNADASPPQPGLPVAVGSGSVYAIIETRYVRAYVSSGSDLATATWTEATGSPSEILPNTSGIDVSAGNNDSGHFGEGLSDGRLLAAAYQVASNVEVVNVLVSENLHWQTYTNRARLTGPTTISWDLIGLGNTWNSSFGNHNEGLPAFPRPHGLAVSSTGRWHIVRGQDGGFTSGMLSNASQVDDGSSNLAISFVGPATDVDRDLGSSNPWQAAIVPLGSGFMLLVNTLGQAASGGIVNYTNLRYQESTSESTWSTTAATATNIPNLSSASNRPNDWGIVSRTTTDVHVVRRNSATVLEQVRYSGHSGSWGSVTTLPATGLTGHLANSGVALVSDGTSVWCFIIDTDASNSIRYNIWTSAAGWLSSWLTLDGTGSGVKNFINATMGSGQIGVVWTEGADPGPYAVNTVALSTATPVSGQPSAVSYSYLSN